MCLSHDLISQFVKVTNDKQVTKKETITYGTVVELDGKKYVRLDGSEMLTPVSSTADSEANERVTVLIKDHTATITGNSSSPAARKQSVDDAIDQITEVEILVADKVSTSELDAEKARIDTLVSDNVTIKERLTASEASIDNLEADNITINETLTAQNGEIENLKVNVLTVDVADAKYATIENLEATDADFRSVESDYASFKNTTTENFTAVNASITNLEANKLSADAADLRYASIGTLEAVQADVNSLEANYASFKTATADNFTAVNASIDDLETNKLSAESADLKYANIDFSNINQAAIKKVFSESGIIKDLVVSDGKITGELVGVTIKGDIIEGGTVKADKLVILGEDGLYYKLNVNALGETTAASDPKYQNGLDGSVIVAKSITAEKVAVNDLVAFGATIGGFHITKDSIHSGAKSSINNTTRGIYLDNSGQIAFGDSSNFIKYYKDQNGDYKLEISAKSILIGSSGKNVETIAKNAENAIGKVNSLEERANSGEFNGEDAVTLRIESSRGTVFKNDSVSTILSVVIYRGSDRITNSSALASAFGSGAYLQWKWQRLDDESFGVISSSDSRFGDNGFTFTLSPEDVDTKITFMCELIV